MLNFFSELVNATNYMRKISSDTKEKIRLFKDFFLNNKQLAKIIVIGQVGSGKSRIIHSFLHFVELWNYKNRIGTFTPTRKVAALLRVHSNAGTWHSKLGIRQDSQGKISNKKKNFLQTYRNRPGIRGGGGGGGGGYVHFFGPNNN